MRLAQRSLILVAAVAFLTLALGPAADACTQDCVWVRPGCFVCEDVGYFTNAACHGSGCYCVFDPVTSCKAPVVGGPADQVAPAAWVGEEKPASALCTEKLSLPESQPTA